MTVFISGLVLTGPFCSSPCILFFYHLPPPRVPTQGCRAAIIVFCVVVYKNTCQRKKWKTCRQSKLPFTVQPNWGGTEWEQFAAPDTADFFFQIAYLPFKLYQNEFAWLPDPSESMSLFNAEQRNQCFSSNCHLFEFGPFSRAMTLYHKTTM